MLRLIPCLGDILPPRLRGRGLSWRNRIVVEKAKPIYGALSNKKWRKCSHKVQTPQQGRGKTRRIASSDKWFVRSFQPSRGVLHPAPDRPPISEIRVAGGSPGRTQAPPQALGIIRRDPRLAHRPTADQDLSPAPRLSAKALRVPKKRLRCSRR